MKNLVQRNFIGEYHIDPKLCDKLIKLHKKTNRSHADKDNPAPWLNKDEGRVGSGVVHTHKRSIDVGIDPMIIYNPKIAGPSYKQDIKLIIDYYLALNNCVNRYAHELSQCSHDKGHDGGQELCAFYHVTERMNIQHYKPGEGFYAWHHERGEIAMHRELVFMTYLNDVPDGGTEFLYQDLTTTAKKGKTLIWPANYTHIHRGQISKTQEKYIITGWLGYNHEKKTSMNEVFGERRQGDQ